MNVKEWNSEKRSYEKTAVLLTGDSLRVKDIEPSQIREIGYTSANKTIHLAYDHPVMDGLTKAEKIAFRKGVFAHELLHQIFTDFKSYNHYINSKKLYERSIMAIICNVLEDPAIENFACTVMGGNLLSCLRFSIAHIYRISGDIDEKDEKTNEDPSPMSQFINALIQFGDMGLIKGKFLYPEVKRCFAESAPIFYKGIHEPVSKERLKLAGEIFEISRPLWETEVEAEQKKMVEKMIESLVNSTMNGSGSGSDGNPDMLPEGDKKDKRRKITIKKVSKEEYDEMKKNSSKSGPIPEDGDITICVCDEADDKDENKAGSSSSVPVPAGGKKNKEDNNANDKKSGSDKISSDTSSESDSDSSDDSSGTSSDSNDDSADASSKKSSDSDKEKNEENESGKSTGDSEKTSEEMTDESNEGDKNGKNNGEKNDDDSTNSESDETESENNNSSNNNPFRAEGNNPGKIKPGKGNEGEATDNEENIAVDSDEYVLSQDDIEYIKKEQEKDMEEYENEENAELADESALENFPISSAALGTRSCLNYRVAFKESDRTNLESAYEEVLGRLAPGIKNLTAQLKKIFQNDAEEKLYKGSGRVNINRINSGRVTSRVFDKKRSPSEKDDLAVMLVIDESGSMRSYGKYISARESAIALAEVLNLLNIPVYIIGFTADTQGYDVVHNHYVTWKNTKSDRLKLLNISARADNLDGYSIRYATQIMKKAKAKNKLMIVLSDGQPAACRYSDGIADTKDAIREAKKQSSVLGVAIGNSDTNTIHYMYENDFLHISNIEQLFSGLARKIKILIKNWD